MIFVSTQDTYERRVFLADEIHAKLVEDCNDVKFEDVFAFDNLDQNFIDERYEISILFDQSIKLSIIDTKSKLFV